MKIYYELDLKDFEAWSGAINTLDTLTDEQINQLENMLPDILGDDCDETAVNDYLWFETDHIAEMLGFRNWEHLERANNGDYEPIRITCSNIVWDVDKDEEVDDLPDEVSFKFEDEDDIEEYYEHKDDCDVDDWLSDKLSDKYNFCVESFEYKENK